MEITRKNTPNYEKKKKNLIENFSIKIIMLSFFLFVVLFSFLVYKITIDYFPTGIRPWLINEAKEYGFRQLNQKTRFFDALSHAPKYFFEHTDIPEIFIDIKFKHLEKLRSKREKALKVGILEKSGDDFVPAEIRIENRTINTKLRLKGDWTDHLEGKNGHFAYTSKGKTICSVSDVFLFSIPKPGGSKAKFSFLKLFVNMAFYRSDTCL